jgi:hypothetical protein
MLAVKKREVSGLSFLRNPLLEKDEERGWNP